MGRKKIVQAETLPGIEPGAPAPSGEISKMEAVRRCLAAGVEKPMEALAWIKTNLGIEIASGNFSAYKSQLKAKGKTKKPAPGKPQADSKNETDPLAAAQAVQALVKQYGAKTVKGLADMFE